MDNNQFTSSDHDKTLSHPRPSRLGWVLRYGLALGAVTAGMGLWQAAVLWLGSGLPPYITFYPVVMIVALVGGLGPGLLATALAGLAACYWILPPVGQFAIARPADRLGLVVFTGMGVFMSAVADLYRRRRHKAAAYDREAALRESQARLATFAEATFEGIVESEAGRIVDCNEQLARMLGYSVADLKGMEIASLVAPEDRDRVMAKVREGRESLIEHALLRKDGTRIVVEVHGRPVAPGSARRHTAIRDITARQRAEEALRGAKEEWERTFDSVPDLIAVIDAQHRIVRANRAMAERLGVAPAQCIGQSCYACVHGTDGPPMFCPHTRTLADGQEHTAEVHEDRLGGDFLVTTTPLLNEQGQQVGSVHVARDITDRKRAEAALRDSEERYRNLFNAVDAGFCVIEVIFDAAGKPVDYRFLEVNAAFEKQTGLHDAEGKLMRDLAPAHEAHWFEIYGSIAMTGEARHFVNEASQLNRWYDVYAYRVGAPESRHVAILFNDITAHKQAETELRRRAEELRAANEELTRFNRVTVGRELRIIELKKQVNELRAQLGQPPRYSTELGGEAPPAP